VMENAPISAADVERLFNHLNMQSEASGYHLNPDREFARELVGGLLVNEGRYGYAACPCRLASGDEHEDLDIVCPCDYRDADLLDWGSCYCALYVSEDVLRGESQVQPIPERRPPSGQRAQSQPASAQIAPDSSSRLAVWRCRVCGYLCARPDPPAVCPICGAKRDRFERFW
jgi:ferredoxin-thioredoxin reductase catalytic subunit